jgi:hypothetical protein
MAANESTSTAARALAARRRQVAGRCARCGTEFTGAVTRIYCSTACRLKASREHRRRNDTTQPSDISALMRDAHARTSRGRLFDDSAELIRYGREQRTAQLTGEEFSDAQFAIESLNRQRELNELHGWANTPEGTEILRELREAR